VKSVYLALSEPVALILYFIGSYPCMAYKRIDIYLRVKLLTIFYIIFYKPTIIEGIICSYFIVGDITGRHMKFL
jgi:hypothetical protein